MLQYHVTIHVTYFTLNVYNFFTIYSRDYQNPLWHFLKFGTTYLQPFIEKNIINTTAWLSLAIEMAVTFSKQKKHDGEAWMTPQLRHLIPMCTIQGQKQYQNQSIINLPKNYALFLFQKNNQLIFKPITVCQNLTIQKIPNSQNQKNHK